MTTAPAIALAFFSALNPYQLSVSQRASSGQILSFTKSPVFKRIPLSSSPSSSLSCVVVEEDGPSPSPDRLPVGPESTSTQNPNSLPRTRGCEACGREELEKGCNGEGRIQGGIATVPGFGWWPIKAYRPCPGFVASGGRYRRRGQSMDEVAFGRGEKGVSVGINEEAKSSKKKQGSRRFKR